jgi:glycosyltransferase involved in cell wall biosynthesis
MTESKEHDAALAVVAVTNYSVFPLGMAASNRLLLIGRALTEAGCDFRVLEVYACQPANGIAVPPRGKTCGIEYEYTGGRTRRGASFATRRWLELRGSLGLLLRLRELRREGKCDVIYLYRHGLRLSNALCVAFARSAGIPIALELNESPARLRDATPQPFKEVSPLWGGVGAIAISRFLVEWIQAEGLRLGRRIVTCHTPILCDMAEQSDSQVLPDSRTVTISCASEYFQTIAFALEAMKHVWRARPDFRVVVTGAHHPELYSKTLKDDTTGESLQEKVLFSGYLSRAALLRQYSASAALLIPLFDDEISRARFPTKVAEYLASGRPVVTTSVGEVSHYLTDRVTAYLGPPGCPKAYGAKILEVLSHPAEALLVGEAGRCVAMQHFHYANHSRALRAFFSEVSLNSQKHRL